MPTSTLILVCYIILQTLFFMLKGHGIYKWWLVFIPTYLLILGGIVFLGLFMYAMNNMH